MNFYDFLLRSNDEFDDNWKTFDNQKQKQNFIDELVSNMTNELQTQIFQSGIKIYSKELASLTTKEFAERLAFLNSSKINFNSILSNAKLACKNKFLLQLVAKKLGCNGFACLENENSPIYPYLNFTENLDIDEKLIFSNEILFNALNNGTKNLEQTYENVKSKFMLLKQKLEALAEKQNDQDKNSDFITFCNLKKKIDFIKKEIEMKKKIKNEIYAKLELFKLSKKEKKILKESYKNLDNSIKTQTRLLNSYLEEKDKFKDCKFIEDQVFVEKKNQIEAQFQELKIVKNTLKTYIDFSHQICRHAQKENNFNF